VLARRRLVGAALHVRGLAERDDRAAVAVLAAVIDALEVVALVHRARLGSEAALANRVQQRQRVKRLVLASGADVPRERQVRGGAHGPVELVAVVIPLRQTPDVKRGADKPPCCEHGEWTFAGADSKRGATKLRCPTGECKPAFRWIKADSLHP